MRILGFSHKDWLNYITNKPKLEEQEFTTFRVKRKDEDWRLHEKVQIVIKPRSKEKEILGIASIFRKEKKSFFYMPDGLLEHKIINNGEAKRDGFPSSHLMFLEMLKMHGDEKASGLLNKLTLHWQERIGKAPKLGVVTPSSFETPDLEEEEIEWENEEPVE